MNIGDVSKASGVSAKMIRYYEETGLIQAAGRTAAGYRTYDGTDVQILRFIRRSRDLGFSVEKIAELLALWRDKTRQSADVKRLAQDQIDVLKWRIAEMETMVRTLSTLVDACCGDQRPDCPILDDLGAVDGATHEALSGQLARLSGQGLNRTRRGPSPNHMSRARQK